jgi:hypothetical protein
VLHPARIRQWKFCSRRQIEDLPSHIGVLPFREDMKDAWSRRLTDCSSSCVNQCPWSVAFKGCHLRSVERFAVQRRARRTNGSLMLLQCPCGGIVRCNGLFDGRTTSLRNFSDQPDPISHQRRDPSTLATSATTIAITSPHRRADGRYPSQVRRSSSPSCSSMTSLRGTFHHHRLTVERFAVQRRARRTSGSLMLLQCPCGGIVRCNGLFDGPSPRRAAPCDT